MADNQWGQQDGDQSVVWWDDTGTPVSAAPQPIPDPDAWYMGDVGDVQSGDEIWPGGGSDGLYNYFAVIGADGGWYVDRFSADMLTLVDRFPIPGWSSLGYSVGGDQYLEQNYSVKHVSVRGGKIVVVAQLVDYTADNSYGPIQVAVLDAVTGALLYSHDAPTYPASGWERLEDSSSSCIDADALRVYFAIHDWDFGDTFIVSVDLTTGATTTLYDIYAVNNAIAAMDVDWFGYDYYPARQDGDHGGVHDVHGLLSTPDGDLIITAGHSGDQPSGMMRVQPDGTPVWWKHLPALIPGVAWDGWWGISHSTRGTFWVSRTDASFLADEYDFDGNLIQTIELAYPARHAWLLAAPAVPPEPVGPTPTASGPVCILGSPDTQIFLMDRCGSRTICELTDSVSFNDYGLVLDNDSECEVSLHFKGDASGRACCECLEDARTWRNEIMVLRGGKVVWGPGPLVTANIQREIGHLVARDISAWLDVRLVHTDYDFVDADLATIAETCIVDGLTLGDAELLPKEWRDMCILDFATFMPTGKKTDMKIVANQKSAGEVLRSLTEKGLNYTVVKRSLIVGADFAWGPIGPLRDSDFQGDLVIGEHGLAAATSWRVASTNNTGKAGGIDPYFGLIERAVEGFGEDTQEAVDREAADRLSGTNPPPVTVNIPSDSALSPRAPVCQENLIPGTMVDLAVNSLCRGIQTRQRLTAIDYKSDENGELVSVTIAPAGNVQLEEE